MKAGKFLSIVTSILITFSCIITSTIIKVTAVHMPEVKDVIPVTTSTTISGQNYNTVPKTTATISKQPKVVVVPAISTPDGYVTVTTTSSVSTTSSNAVSCTLITTETTKSSVSSSREYQTIIVSVFPMETEQKSSTSSITEKTIIYTIPCTHYIPIITTITSVPNYGSQHYYYDYSYDITLDDITASCGETIKIPFDLGGFPNTQMACYERFKATVNFNVPDENFSVSAKNNDGKLYETISSNSGKYVFNITEQTGYFEVKINDNIPCGEYNVSCDGNAEYSYLGLQWVHQTYIFNEETAVIRIEEKSITTPVVTTQLAISTMVSQTTYVSSMDTVTSLMSTIVWRWQEMKYEDDIFIGNIKVLEDNTVQIPFEIENFPDTETDIYSNFFVNLNVELPYEGIGISVISRSGEEYELIETDENTYTFKVIESRGYINVEIDETVPVGEYRIKIFGDAKNRFLDCMPSGSDYYIYYTWFYEYYVYNLKSIVIDVRDGTVTTPAVTEPIETTSTTVTSTESTTEISIISGDANGDNELNVRDCAYIAENIAYGLISELTIICDFNNDKIVNVRDAVSIAIYLSKKSSVF